MTNKKSVKRVKGGFGFTSAMLRNNVSTEKYVKLIVKVINMRLFDKEEVLSYEIKGEDFTIYCKEKEILFDKLDYVEECRGMSFTRFEKVMIKAIEREGMEIYIANSYYEAVMQKNNI